MAKNIKSKDPLKRELEINKALFEMSSSLVAESESLNQITDITLEFAKLITDSEHGYVSIIDQKTGDNVSYTITEMMGKECRVKGENLRIAFPADENGHYPKLWGFALNNKKAFYTNNPGKHESSGGLPQGHIPLKNFLSAPSILNGRLMGQVALANSKTGYSDIDLKAVSVLSQLFAVAVGRKHTEKKLSTSVEKYRTLVNNILGMVYREKPGWVTEIVSNSESVCGYKPDEFSSGNRKWIDLIHPADRKIILEQGSVLQQKPTTLSQKYRIINKENKIKWVRDSKQSIFNDGKFQFVDGVVVDITEHIHAREERDQLHTKLQHAQKIEALGTLAGGIAHDFNNILTPILGYSKLIKLNRSNDDQLIEDILEIEKAAGRARDLVNQILTFCRMTETEFKAVQIDIIIIEALKLIRSTIPTTIEINTSIERTNEYVMADPTQIHQIIMNLCANAGHAMEKKGGLLEVSLTAKTVDELTEYRISDKTAHKYLVLKVKDTGVGIPDDIVANIFDPYFTTKELGEGTGLGLSMVQGIVKNCGGEIFIESEPDKGTEFTLLFPVVQLIKTEYDREQVPVFGGKESILLIDDEPSVLKVNQRILEGFGYIVMAESDCENALKKFKENPDKFDLLITDMTMPKMNGMTIAKEVLAIKPGFPVIICTGYSKLITKEQCRDIGIKALIYKPLSIQITASEIRKIFDGK